MSGSSPSDLVVTFRSIPRRLREARGDAPDSALGPLTGELRAKLDLAARTMGTAPDPNAIADAIAAVPTREWDDERLETLRTVALDLGALLRSVQSAAAAWRRD